MEASKFVSKRPTGMGMGQKTRLKAKRGAERVTPRTNNTGVAAPMAADEEETSSK